MGTTATKRKYQTTSKHFDGDDSDSDSHEHVRLQKETRQLRKPQHALPHIPVLAAAEVEPLAPDLLTRQIANPVHNTSTTRSLRRKLAAQLLAARGAGAPKNRVNTRCTAKRKIQTSAANRECALELQSDSFKTSLRGNCRTKRKRWSSSISTTLWGSDNPDNQPTKRHRQGIDRGEDTLWTRLNQLDPRKQRSS